MKSLYLFGGLLILGFLSSCQEDDCVSTITYMTYEPVYKSAAEINEEIKFIAERPLETPGKIYYYRNFMLISDRGTGVHVIDNSDVRNPERLGFIEIDGNEDIAFSGNYIYADTRFNIIVIDIENIEEPTVVNVINEVKEQYWEVDDGTFIVDFVETEVTEEVSCDQARGGCPACAIDNNLDLIFTSALESADAAGGAGSGQGGSHARMALFGGYFYYVNNFSMHVFDVKDLANPEKISEVFMEWGVETIFPYEDKLFIGANNGMHIYDNEDPNSIEYLSTFQHARACDPVVVEDDIAYVTLRDGTECQNFINQLDVVDVSNLLEPQLIASFEMHHPHGLAVRDQVLYLCEGDEGLKVFDVSNVEVIHENQIGQVKEFDAYDVISASPSLLLMIGADGFHQFETSQPANPELLSSILVGQ